MPDYSKEQLHQLYTDLPEDLQEAIYSEQNARNIQEICAKNSVTDDDLIYEITKNTGYVLLGLLSPNDLLSVLENELKLKQKTAEQVATGITRFIFFPVRVSLEALYKIVIKSPTEPLGTTTGPLETASPPREKKPRKSDVYRETLE